jgi:hypothetical protein
VRRLDLPQTLPSFPVGCVRWSLTPIPSVQVVVQNWLPEDLLGQAAASGLATAPFTANQFAYYATRQHNSLSTEALLAFGVKVNGLRRATADLTAPPVGGTGVRLYLERGPVSAGDDSATLVGDVDLRTSNDEATNTGIHVSSSATIADLPDIIRVDYANTPTQPFHFTWRANSGIALTNGVLDVLLPGPTALVVHGAFESGAVPAGGLPPAGDLLVGVSADQSTHVFLWSKPAAVTDTFPTPVVPAFDPNTITRVHAGAEISTLDQRNAGLAIRAHAAINVPQPVAIAWVTAPDGTLNTATALLCDPSHASACAATELDATATMGPRTDTSPTALLTPPALPTPDGTIQNTVPTFTPFRPASGARAVIFSPTSWGADLLVRGVARVAYNRVPQNYEVQLANTSPQPFRVEVLDASTIIHGSNGFDRPQVLFADALVDQLPQQMRVQLDDSTTDNQPLVWVNTEDLGITDITNVDFNTTDAPATRPVITGVVRVGDAQILALGVPAASRPTPPRTAAKKGIDLFGGFDADRGFFGVDASFALDLPRHVAVWRPISSECTETATPPANVDTCQNKPAYEIDRTRKVEVQFKTTSQSLGNLELNGFLAGTNLDLGVHATIGNVPGQLDGTVTMAENARLPWTTVSASMSGNAPLQSVAVEVADQNNAVNYENNTGTQPTSKFGVVLTNVPAQLNVSTHIVGIEDRVSDPPVPPPADPCSGNAHPTEDFGYAHAQLDLAGTSDAGQADLNFFFREVGGQVAAKMTSNAPVSGFVNARIDHLAVKIAAHDCVSTNQKIEAGAIGVLVKGVEGAGIGAGIGADIGGGIGALIGAGVGFVIGAIVGFLLAIFESPEVTFSTDFDADLPFFIQFDKTTEVDVGLDTLTLRVAQNQPSGGAPLQVGFRQQSLADEPQFSADGAWFRHRSTSYVGSNIPLQDDWNIGNDISNPALATIGVYDYSSCKSADTDHPCYQPGNNNVASVADADHSFVIDPFFTQGNRSELKDNEGGTSVSPGSELFKRIADQGNPLPDAAFDFSEPVESAAQSQTFSQETNCCTDATAEGFVGSGFNVVDLGNQGAVCEYPTSDVNTVARGTDGTEYVVAAGGTTTAVTDTQHRSLCSDTSYILQAHFPKVAGDRLGPMRWSVRLPTPAGLEGNGACQQHNVRCELSYTVSPQPDGTVHVTESTTVITNGVTEASLNYTFFESNLVDLLNADVLSRDLAANCCPAPATKSGDAPSDGGSTLAMVDASGHPGFWKDGDAVVDSFDATTNGVTVADAAAGEFSLDPCQIASFGCALPAAGERLVWLFGDGSTAPVAIDHRVDPAGVPAVQTHIYPKSSTPQPFVGELIKLGPDCSGDSHEQCDLENKAYFTLSN